MKKLRQRWRNLQSDKMLVSRSRERSVRQLLSCDINLRSSCRRFAKSQVKRGLSKIPLDIPDAMGYCTTSLENFTNHAGPEKLDVASPRMQSSGASSFCCFRAPTETTVTYVFSRLRERCTSEPARAVQFYSSLTLARVFNEEASPAVAKSPKRQSARLKVPRAQRPQAPQLRHRLNELPSPLRKSTDQVWALQEPP